MTRADDDTSYTQQEWRRAAAWTLTSSTLHAAARQPAPYDGKAGLSAGLAHEDWTCEHTGGEGQP